MDCKISKCICGIFTTDGYCEKHKYYTRYDNKIIMSHNVDNLLENEINIARY